jgi:trigger factor
MVKWEKIDDTRVSMEVEIAAERLERALEQAYKKVVQRVNLPGFRKGKAPRHVLERRLGAGVLYDEAAEMLVPEAYDRALAETGLKALETPEIDLVQLEQGKPLVFKATVEVMPEVALGEYLGIEAEVAPKAVSDEDVDRHLEQLRRKHARLRVVEDGVLESGDLAVIDFAGFIDGVPFEGGTAEGYSLEIGSGSFIPGFEEQLAGLRSGEEKDVAVTFPEDYHAGHLAGREAVFKVLLREIKRKEFPPLDDSFAAEVSDFAALDEFKADVKNKLKAAAEKTARRELAEQVVEAVAANASVALPEVLVEREIGRVLGEMEQFLNMQGLSLEKYMEISGKSLYELREERREDAGKQVKTALVLEAIAEKEGIEASDEEIEEKVKELAAAYRQDLDKVREYFRDEARTEGLRREIRLEKTRGFLVGRASVREALPAGEEDQR